METKSKVKFKNLKKLSFKREEANNKKINLENDLKILESNDLTIMNNSEDTFDIFDAISYLIFNDTSKSERLKIICENYLMDFFKKDNFPEEFEFLNKSYFKEIYQKKKNHNFFEGVI
jgi:hypothetical protein